MTDVERPAAPGSVAATGLGMGVLADPALKTLHFASNIDGADLAKRLALSLNATTELLEFLRRERLCEVMGGTGRSAATVRSSLTSKGIDSAAGQSARSGPLYSTAPRGTARPARRRG